MKRVLATAATATLVATAAGATVVPPAPGVPLPPSYYEMVRRDKTAFRFERAWKQKAERIRAAREAYVDERGFYNRALLSAGTRSSYSVTGTVRVPVFCAEFANRPASYASSVLQTRLFDGPHSPQTLTEFYTEMSYGDVTMTGTVFGWFTLSSDDAYYEGGVQGLGPPGRVNELITETLTNYDGAVDFGVYDNDGPDGIPNSGDDDGYVDFAAFVHSETGAECTTSSPNIWSHRWTLTGYQGFPYQTNDPAAGGGFILVDDYVIQPAFSCDSPTQPIEIGVFCHEFGHAFGLPDLYDLSQRSEGIGAWGLMGSGNWHTPDSPAHMCAWTKDQLGWVNVIDVGGVDAPYSVPNAEFNRTVYRLPVMEERWRRSPSCAIAGGYSMRCALNATEARGRNWVAGSGYGDGWIERMVREFPYDGTGPVTLQFDYTYECEDDFDYCYVRIEVGGTKSTLATYTGAGGAFGESLDLTPYLSGSGVSSYRVSFEFESDLSWSDRDGSFPTTCGAFVVDNIILVGGGTVYATDFEQREDGWYADMSNPAERFYLTNRQPVGSDAPISGGGGILIWHVNEDVARTGQAGNTGGDSGDLPHGVALEQADGLDHLSVRTDPVNWADAGDPFPGATNNTLFTNVTNPASRGYSGLANNVSVQLTSANPLNGDPMSVVMRGGAPAPTFANVVPDTGRVGEPVTVSVSGGGIFHGAEVELTDGSTTVPGTVTWVGRDLLSVEFDLTGMPLGSYDVVIRNPGGASATGANAFTVDEIVPAAIRSFAAAAVGVDAVQLEWVTIDDLDVMGWHVYRSTHGAGGFVRMTDAPLAADARSWRDESPESGARHTYRLTWITEAGEVFAAQATVRVGQLRFALLQNHPNPFNPSTVIPFELRDRVHTTLRVYNVRGQLVRTLVDEVLDARPHEIAWDGSNDAGSPVSSGVYFYRIDAGSFQDVRKMVLVK